VTHRVCACHHGPEEDVGVGPGAAFVVRGQGWGRRERRGWDREGGLQGRLLTASAPATTAPRRRLGLG